MWHCQISIAPDGTLYATVACGFKQWHDVERPCLCCTSNKSHTHEYPASIATSTWTRIDAKAYNQQVATAIASANFATSKQLEQLWMHMLPCGPVDPKHCQRYVQHDLQLHSGHIKLI